MQRQRVYLDTARIASALALALILAPASGRAQSPGLLARSINNFSLDMTIDQVKAAAGTPLTPLPGGHYKGTIEGIDYNFTFSAQGHLYCIASRQQIAVFTPDDAFAAVLTERLVAKYGPPAANKLPAGPAFWKFEESVPGANGPAATRETESLLVMLAGGGSQAVAVEMQLQDLRIQRRDAATAPRNEPLQPK